MDRTEYGNQDGYYSRVVLRSINELGDELVTWETQYPYGVHQDPLTHRMLSRNAMSGRAIPTQKVIDQVMSNPVMPPWWGRNQRGMQAHTEVGPDSRDRAITSWLRARDAAVTAASDMAVEGIHKQHIQQLLMPWMWIRVVYSATDWENFFKLRQSDHRTASALPDHPTLDQLKQLIDPDFGPRPEIQILARMMFFSLRESTPRQLKTNEWHLPFLAEIPGEKERLIQEGFQDDLVHISAGRTARVSYLNHNGLRDPQDDIRLNDSLVDEDGWSPKEHPAKATPYEKYGNFTGFMQYRKTWRYPRESGQHYRPWYGSNNELLHINP